MTPEQVMECLQEGQRLGCVEALFCLGDKPDRFPLYQNQLTQWGFQDTIQYLEWAGEQALHHQLLPHTNAGVLSREQMIRLQKTNVSLGLMLETISPRLRQPGMVHYHAPDKDPMLRIQMHQEAGELRIPFTTGLLVGMGETEKERVESLVAIREIHAQYHHIQEVIIQPLRIHVNTPLAQKNGADPSKDLDGLVRTIALARLMLPSEVSVQAPPNLSAPFIAALIDAGINDFGGISPLTPDYINPEYPWPHLDQLKVICGQQGYELVPRLPIYPHYLNQPDYTHPLLLEPIQKALTRISRIK
jgi:FO synthase